MIVSLTNVYVLHVPISHTVWCLGVME